MITAEQQRSWVQQLMTHADAGLPGKSLGWLRHAREAARQAVAELPVLDRKQEAWRYTSIEALLKHRFRPASAAADLPALDISDRPFHPIHAGMYHPPGGILRHDAVVWGLAKGACQHGVHIHQGVEVTGIDTDGNKITGVQTSQGAISCNKLGVMAGGYGASVCSMVGMELPVHPLTIQAMVTQPLKPFLNIRTRRLWRFPRSAGGRIKQCFHQDLALNAEVGTRLNGGHLRSTAAQRFGIQQ